MTKLSLIEAGDLRMQVTGKSKGKYTSDGEVSDKPIPDRAEISRPVTQFKGLPRIQTNIPGMVSVNGIVMSNIAATEWDPS